MKITFVSTVFDSPWGGSEELWAQAADAALRDGHEVHLFLFRWPEMAPQVRALQAAGAHLHLRPRHWENIGRLLLMQLAMRTGDRPVPVRLTAFRELPQVKPDVVCISQGDPYASTRENVGLVRWLERSGVPYVPVIHFADDHEVLRPFDGPRTARFLTAARSVAFVAEGNRRTVERQLALRLPHAVLLRNPVNLADHAPVAWPGAGRVEMATVARLAVYHKGQDVLFEALAGERWRDRDWRLNLYGDGRDARVLRSLSDMYGLADRIVFHGHVTDIRDVWSRNHLLVLPSRAEGIPLALVEAMLCGRPSVATDVGGHREWLEEGETGWLAAAASPRALSDALERSWQARPRWPAMGVRAHEHAAGRVPSQPGRALLELLVRHGVRTRPDAGSDPARTLSPSSLGEQPVGSGELLRPRRPDPAGLQQGAQRRP